MLVDAVAVAPGLLVFFTESALRLPFFRFSHSSRTGKGKHRHVEDSDGRHQGVHATNAAILLLQLLQRGAVWEVVVAERAGFEVGHGPEMELGAVRARIQTEYTIVIPKGRARGLFLMLGTAPIST